MALTTDQWYSKLKTWVPSWYFQGEEQSVCFTRGVFKGFAAVLSQIQTDCDDAQSSTFIMNAADVAPIVDLHGSERSQARNGDLDAPYKIRIRDCLFKRVDALSLAAAADAVLNNGNVTMIENWQNGFCDDDNSTALFFDDSADNARWLESTKWYNWWTMIVPIQTAGVEADIKTAIVAAIEANKAYGTTYDILFKSLSDTDVRD